MKSLIMGDSVGDENGSGPPSNVQNSNTPTSSPDDFSEYMWMENEEEFDNDYLRQLEEEALMQECIQAMIADEIDQAIEDGLLPDLATLELEEKQANSASSNVKLNKEQLETMVKTSTLNPEAKPFVPKAAVPDKTAIDTSATTTT